MPQTYQEVSLQSQTVTIIIIPILKSNALIYINLLKTFSELVKLVPPKEGEATSYKEMFHAAVDDLSLPALPYLGNYINNIKEKTKKKKTDIMNSPTSN